MVTLSFLVLVTLPFTTALPEMASVPAALLLAAPRTISPFKVPPEISMFPLLLEPPMVFRASVLSPPVKVPPVMVSLPASMVSSR